MYHTAIVLKRGEKEFDVVLGEKIIGTAKSDCDARFHANAINDALYNAYQAGQRSGAARL